MSESIYCVNHPNVETRLRCNKCGDPICVKCAVLTPVGYRCSACVNRQQQTFYADFQPIYYLIAAAVALPLALAAGWIIPDPRLSWYPLILGPLAGMGIAEAARWAIGQRRGEYTWLLVCGCILFGALPRLLLLLLSFAGVALVPEGALNYLAGGWVRLLWNMVYLVAAVGAAYARLRPGRRV